jgi:hypothetical protein
MAAMANLIEISDFPVPAGPSIRVLEPDSTPPPSSASNSLRPVESWVRSKDPRCSAATSRGKTLMPPVLIVKS